MSFCICLPHPGLLLPGYLGICFFTLLSGPCFHGENLDATLSRPAGFARACSTIIVGKTLRSQESFLLEQLAFYYNLLLQLVTDPTRDYSTSLSSPNSSLHLLLKHSCNKKNRRPGFKGHLIEFLLILHPYFGPLWIHLNPFGPIRT